MREISLNKYSGIDKKLSGEIKIFKLAFTIILLTSLITYTAAASSVTLSLSPQVISAGETFTVDVFVDPDVAIAGIQLPQWL